MTQTYVRLSPNDNFYYGGDPLDGTPSPAMRALIAADLVYSFLASPTVGITVGDYLLLVPSGFREVAKDEVERLDSARQSALRNLDRLMRFAQTRELNEVDQAAEHADGDAGARLLLLRGRGPSNVESYEDFDFLLRTGETLAVSRDRRSLPRQMWAVIEVSASWMHDGSGRFWFDYKLVDAVPDAGPLRLSDVDASSSKSLCFDMVCRYLLTALDLSHVPLPDPAEAMSFLQEAHRRGLPRDMMPEMFGKDGNTKRGFVERMSAAMEASRKPLQVGSGGQPERRLIKTFVDAEHYAAEYTRYLGFTDAMPTPVGSDGGIDVVASGAIAQVKMEGVATGRPVVQAIFGIASLEDKRALVFSLAGYTAQALEWADNAGVACFEFAVDGSVEPASRVAREINR